MRSIKVLPESVRSCMRSGIILFDLTRVVEELVFNSLDAGAAKVIVAVGVGTSYIKVTDNGCGVTRDGLVLLGERYATSKFEQLAGLNTVPESFGFRGEALSSIADVSLLEVVTKAHGMPNGYRKVIKGCKCLYLGIDDDRHDVGTTVVVRDLFYNQPVKRRHFQSSPKKVLHSVKESILRIALVHLATYFKVIDTESGDELLSLYPSSSPLPLLKSCFGSEVSHSLDKLDESDGELKLSGYISGPDETFSVKAFQYFYINSRYISRGPIHKLLNQLATMQNCSELSKADIISQCGKRSWSQASPTYILNLTCPRAHYDLSFEPAKTSVEFKDWDPVFTFIKKSISCLWSQGVQMSEEDDIWNGADTLSTRDDPLNDYGLRKKRCMKRCNQDSFILSSPQLEMPRVEPKLTPFSRYSCNKFKKQTAQPEDFGYISSKDTFLETNEQMDLLSDAKWDLNNSLAVKESSAGSFHLDDDGHNIRGDLMKPFLRRCSSRMDVSPIVKSTKGDNHFRFQADRFKKWLDTDDRVDNEEADYISQGSKPLLDDTAIVWSPPRITTTSDLGTDSNILSKRSFDSVLTGEDCLTEDYNHRASPVASYQCDWSPSRVGSPFGKKMHVEPLTDVVSRRHFKHRRDEDLFAYEEKEAYIVEPVTDVVSKRHFKHRRDEVLFSYEEKEADIVEPITDVVSKTHFKRHRDKDLFAYEAKETDIIETITDVVSKVHFKHRRDEDLFSYEVNVADIVEPITNVVSNGHFKHRRDEDLFAYEETEADIVEPITDGVSKRHFKRRRDEDRFAYEEKEADIFNFESMGHSSSWEDCKKNVRYCQNDSILLQKSDFLNGTDWARSESLGKHETCIPVAASCHFSSISNADEVKRKMDQYRYQDKQRRRSCSAPPLYKEKKKFVDLHSLMTFNSGESHHDIFPNASTVQEASHEKHVQKPSDVDTANDLQSKARHDKKKHIDRDEISDFEGEADHCDDVYNLNSDVTLKENQGALDVGVKWRNGCPSTSSTKKPGDILNQESILDISSDKLLPSGGDSLLPKSVSKKCLEACRVLQQVDKKFIPIVGGGIVAIIDQHAADERIRLEDLREKVLSGETKTITYLDAEQELVLPEIGYQLLNNYSEQIQKWGWICNFHTQSSASFKKNLNFLHNQPSVAMLIAVPCILGVSLTDVDLLEFLQQLSDTDGSSVIPPAVLRVLNFKACRGAIMFGDALLPSECSVILEELKQTSMCFQCAHGRPTTVPLVNLAVLHKQIAKLGNRSHGSSEQWHGLSRHRPSLERATERLSQC